jgi:putative Ca2+/H+ antiporter (TMEM165/GDT1 family)
MEALPVSIGIVALAKTGDMIQLLPLVLAARFRKPWPSIPNFEVRQQRGAAATLSHTVERKP